MRTGYDIDGVLTAGYTPTADDVVISGRTFAEYNDTAKQAAQICPVYIRGVGSYGDRLAAAHFKAVMILQLHVDRFYEDDPIQAAIIRLCAEDCEVVVVTNES
jgi:hypothetical protein